MYTNGTRHVLIFVSDNPFNCDCELTWLREYIEERESRVVRYEEPTSRKKKRSLEPSKYLNLVKRSAADIRQPLTSSVISNVRNIMLGNQGREKLYDNRSPISSQYFLGEGVCQ